MSAAHPEEELAVRVRRRRGVVAARSDGARLGAARQADGREDRARARPRLASETQLAVHVAPGGEHDAARGEHERVVRSGGDLNAAGAAPDQGAGAPDPAGSAAGAVHGRVRQRNLRRARRQ